MEDQQVAISIDWTTQIITVPKADLLLVQSVPTEILQLDLNTFRLSLKDLEDDPAGMPFTRTHNHVQPITVGGVTLARVVEILNGYTVTFENGQYAVNLVGANSNVGDVVNVNQVSVRSANSAGLTFSKQIEDQSFEDSRVWLNTVTGLPGTAFPRGTPGDPVSNLADAEAIIEQRSLPKRIKLRGSLTIAASDDISDYDFSGASNSLSEIDVDPLALTNNLVVTSLTLTGDLSGNVNARNSTSVVTLTDFEGEMSNCGIFGVISIADNGTAILNSCYSEVAGTDTPIVQMGLNTTLIIRNYSGGIEIQNMTTGCISSIDLDPGSITIGATNTGGTINVRGVGEIDDTLANGTTIVKSGLVQPHHIKETWQINGLDKSNPLVVNPVARTAGANVNQDVTKDLGTDTITVTRDALDPTPGT